MSKRKKAIENRVKNSAPTPEKTPKEVHFANIYRYFFLPILVIVSLFLKGKTLLVMGIGFIVFALYSFLGWKLRWTHVYLAFQEMQHDRMTPGKIQWDTIKTGTVLKFPILFAITGVVMVVYQLFYL